jgi:hypothetical protein
MIGRLVFALIASAYCGSVVVMARETTVRIVAVVITVMFLTGAIRRLYLSYREDVPVPSGGAATPWNASIDFYRRELEKQRAFASTPAWQIVTAFLIIAWLIAGLPVNRAGPLERVLPAVLVAAAGLLALLVARRFRVRRIQEELDALNSLEQENRYGRAKT